MPPDVLAAVSEQQITCAEGQINIALDEFNTPIIQSINDLFVSSCTDATINLINDSDCQSDTAAVCCGIHYQQTAFYSHAKMVRQIIPGIRINFQQRRSDVILE
jgi:hypothetical protein